ncbi:MAG: phospho-N-acetylmuramoyl-pentapeptide-transferase [Ruminococcus sp.]|nr:phospho-N-acetylmuramoyl-pentapeptide-transferase [Ruminococcus sp.]
MLYSLLPHNLFAVLFAGGTFFIAFFALGFLMRILPKDQGREFAVNGELSEGKPRGAGIIFIVSFILSVAIFIPLSYENLINMLLIFAAMITGYLDDAATTPWGELKKGLLDVVIAFGISFNFIWHNNPDIIIFSHTFSIPKVVYLILGMVLVWASINVTNCSDGVDGLCASVSIVTIIMFNCFGRYTMFNAAMVLTLIAYLWYNCSPSKLLMGDAGSRAIGVFIALTAMQSGHPLMFILLAAVLIVDGGLGLAKLAIIRVTKNYDFMKNIRTPIHDHMRKNKGWSDTQVVIRFAIIQAIIGLLAVYIANI